MAQLTLHKVRDPTKAGGTVKLLREFAGLELGQAMAIFNAIKKGQSKTVEVPFMKLATFKRLMEEKSILVS